MSSAEPGSNGGSAVENVEKQRVHNVIDFPTTDEFILHLIETLDPRFDAAEWLYEYLPSNMGARPNNKPFCDLWKVAGGILGALALNGWSRNRIVWFVVNKSEERLPLDLVRRVVDANDDLLTYVNSHTLSMCIEEIEIYGYTYQLGGGDPELSYIQVCDGYGDVEGLFALARVEDDSRKQWKWIAEDLKRRGIDRLESVCINMASSHVLKEEGFVEAFKKTFPGSSLFGVDIGAYTD